jgi:hypothetical protein
MAEYQIIPMKVWCEVCDKMYWDVDYHDCEYIECGECKKDFLPTPFTPSHYNGTLLCPECESLLDDDYKADMADALAAEMYQEGRVP